MEAFELEFPSYAVPLALPYQGNLPNRSTTLSKVNKGLSWFQDRQAELAKIIPSTLPADERLEYHILQFETQLNLERLQLYQDWLVTDAKPIEGSIYQQHQGPTWYQFLLHSWTGTFLTPDSIQALGYHMADRFAEGRKQNQHTAGPDWFTQSEVDIVTRYQHLNEEAVSQIPKLFPGGDHMAPLKYEPVANPRMGNVPGYYNANTLYYNTFRSTYDLRQCDWLYIHEGIPGHHYQLSYERSLEVPPYRQSWAYAGYREGWAAYVEEESVGLALGLYQSAATRHSMYEWNLIRAVRLVLDVGLNYYGWDTDQAMEVWNQYLPELSEVGHREIERMLRWPAQVVSYLVGAHQIVQLRTQQMQVQGPEFSLLAFHARVLSQGSIPVCTLAQLFES